MGLFKSDNINVCEYKKATCNGCLEKENEITYLKLLSGQIEKTVIGHTAGQKPEEAPYRTVTKKENIIYSKKENDRYRIIWKTDLENIVVDAMIGYGIWFKTKRDCSFDERLCEQLGWEGYYKKI